MKKIICLVLVLLIALSCSAFASTSYEYASTASFAAWCEENDIRFSYDGVDSDGDEGITIKNSSDLFSYRINYFFDENLENCYMRVWDVIEYSSEDFMNVVLACNDVNYDYKYVCFYCDETDNTVTASYDCIFRTLRDVGDIVGEATLTMARILDRAYEVLGEYDK